MKLFSPSIVSLIDRRRRPNEASERPDGPGQYAYKDKIEPIASQKSSNQLTG